MTTTPSPSFSNATLVMSPTGTLIDLGCGTGRFLIKVSKKFPDLELIGVDIAEAIIEVARENVARNGLSNRIKFKIGMQQNCHFKIIR